MRTRDENKEQSIFDATISLTIEEGLQGLSMSKIAKRAKVSAATIYIYYANKEDLLDKVYVEVKKQLSRYMNAKLNSDMHSEQLIKQFLQNIYEFMKDYRSYMLFIEQYSMSPSISVNTTPMFKDLFEYFERGVAQKELKPLSTYLLASYCYLPIMQLAKDADTKNEEGIEGMFRQICELSWSAIKY
ncbi:TetR family transcriptional regulator [Bacillus thuringiensis]|uniref:TetR family transcriptional regulator n=1 Tax=Bacillus thuringiensis TaxID=1428 RepID=A0A9X7G2C9_BACTU|nr:TetR/AcrR family transcriptional regulator [Bacillus thuringiensis]PFT95544.1 TetR family transcriptional regulator [Bacillus thuringiensis]